MTILSFIYSYVTIVYRQEIAFILDGKCRFYAFLFIANLKRFNMNRKDYTIDNDT